jgi:two-component system nitrogen regulation response regulator GlnG
VPFLSRRPVRLGAPLAVPVLLQGETGTGKELAARSIHDQSTRAQGPFLAVNLGALPAPLAAAELFGARKGAYTGAVQDLPGWFGRADGGTLFLDEVGEAPLEVQVMLLRALETGEIVPVGSQTPRRVDVRVVSATDADLEAAVGRGAFRAPLLHRLAGYSIRLPPLRHRRWLCASRAMPGRAMCASSATWPASSPSTAPDRRSCGWLPASRISCRKRCRP